MQATADHPEHHFVDLDGVRLHWVELGEDTNEVPLVLLHGLNNSHLTWRRIAPVLAARRRVLMPDLPGHGHSGRPDASYELAWHSGIIARWLRILGIDHADVVGHSFGGGVAQMLLIERGLRIRRMGLVASGGLGRDVGWLLRLASLPSVVEYFGQPFMAVGTRLAMRCVQGCLSKQDIADLIAFNSRPGSARAFARSVRDVVDWRGQRRSFFHRAHQCARLPPLLVLWGDRDTLIPIAHGQEFVRRLRGATFKRFEGCGHYPHNEKPEEFAAAIGEFFDALVVPPTRLWMPTGRRGCQSASVVPESGRSHG
jgi:pimeloyl-ACP methyl ester carboxylesterase